MRILTLPTFWTIFLDILVWFVIHMGLSFFFTKSPASLFKPGSFFFRKRFWEWNGRLYEIFGIKKWKDKLPDAAPWFRGGFPKRSLASRKKEYLDQFIVETCRGEASHWLVIVVSPVFFLFNEVWVGFVMVGYAVFANMPCIFIQRYNRIRLHGLLLNGSSFRRKPESMDPGLRRGDEIR